MSARRSAAACLWLAYALAAASASGEEGAAPGPSAPLPPEDLSGLPVVTARHWLVAEGASGELLAGEGGETPSKAASTTKMMTCLVVLEQLDRDPSAAEGWVEFSEFAAATRGSRAGLDVGERIRVRDALYALMLPSGNDMANALAEHFDECFEPPGPESPESLRSPSYDTRRRFIGEMNRVAARLGMESTQYRSAIGDGGSATDTTTSAADLLRLARHAMERDDFREIVASADYEAVVATADGGEETRSWENTNQLLRRASEYDGVKTGTTRTVGSCLVASGVRDGRRIYVVVIGSAGNEARYADVRNLFRWAWRQPPPPGG